MTVVPVKALISMIAGWLLVDLLSLYFHWFNVTPSGVAAKLFWESLLVLVVWLGYSRKIK